MENPIIKISPLTKDESNHLRGGFGLINVKAEAADNNSNFNCDSSISNNDKNVNCKPCNCGCAQYPIINMGDCLTDKPAQQ